MATIHRHPVPTDSYDPKRPLNDLLVAQLEHFKHIANSLPPDLRNTVPAEPSIEDREGVDRFIAAITGVHVSRKKATLQLVAKPVRRKQLVGWPCGSGRGDTDEKQAGQIKLSGQAEIQCETRERPRFKAMRTRTICILLFIRPPLHCACPPLRSGQ